MGHTKIILGVLLGLGLAVSACGDSTDAKSACSSCPAAARDICEQGVQNCLDIGGSFVDDCIGAITRACQGQ
jgi:hypothetical protein